MSLTADYGGRWGFFFHYCYGALTRLGIYRPLGDESLAKVRRIVFVCSGNVCRSPVAEALAEVRGFNAASFGVKCNRQHGTNSSILAFVAEQCDQADQIGQELAELLPRLKAHQSTPVASFEPREGDLLVGMEPHHISNEKLKKLYENVNNVQKTLLGLYQNRPNAYIHDPYGIEPHISTCLERIVKTSKNLLRSVPNAQRECMSSTT